MKSLIQAIRNDKLVGRGTCSSVDECFGDDELLHLLNVLGITSAEGAAKWARESELLWREEGTNQRWGEDDDIQLTSYKDYKNEMENE
jgi:hypothetical protein